MVLEPNQDFVCKQSKTLITESTLKIIKILNGKFINKIIIGFEYFETPACDQMEAIFITKPEQAKLITKQNLIEITTN